MSLFSRLQVVALALGVIILIYAVYQSSGSAEAAVIDQYPAAAQFTFLGDYVASSGLGRFLLYQWQAPAAPAPLYGYIPVKRNFWGQWLVGNGGHCSSVSVEQVTSTVDFHAHYLPFVYDYTDPTAYSVVCGHVHDIQAHTAAVRWQDGTITTSLVKQDWFMILKPARQAACQLQLLDNTETVIQTVDLTQVDFSSTDTTTPLPPCTNP